MLKPAPNQTHFEWSLTVKTGETISAKRIFGRRLITARTVADIIPEKRHFSEVIGMPVISAVALKGGVSKTTVCHMTAAAFGLAGLRCLLIDNDAQSSLSSAVLGTESEQLPPADTIAAVYAGRDPLPSEIIRP